MVYGISTLLVALLFANYINPLQDFIQKNMPVFAGSSLLIVAVCFALVTFLLSSVVKTFIDILFTKGNWSDGEFKEIQHSSVKEP